MADFDDLPWSPEEMASYRQPKAKRTYSGPSPWQTEELTRGAVDRAKCPDCWRFHLEGYKNSSDGHCWACHQENQQRGHNALQWSRYEDTYLPAKKIPGVIKADQGLNKFSVR